MVELLPLFVNLAGRRVLLVGGGAVAAAKLTQLMAAGAEVTVVAPEIDDRIDRAAVAIHRRAFDPRDLEGIWLVVAAATPPVNAAVAQGAERRRIFVNAVDDPPNATAYMGGVLRREGVTIAISTSGGAPGLTALIREAFDALLPSDVGRWLDEARRLRSGWRRDGVAMESRRPLLLEKLNELYGAGDRTAHVISPAETSR